MLDIKNLLNLYKDFNLNYNKNNDNIDYKKNSGDKKDNGTMRENDKRVSKDGWGDVKDNSIAKEKN